MKPLLYALLCVLALVVVGGAMPAYSQGHHDGVVIVPDSSVESPAEIGRRAHTNHLILWAPEQKLSARAGLTPDIIRDAYGLPPYDITAGEAAGSQVIAIVDAFDYPRAVADFNAFSQAFLLPQETGDGSVLQVVYATGIRPRYNSGWSQEAALDIEWAHAMAPTAKIVLVEAASNSFADLLQAVDVASGILGVREVSMSWGGSEFSSETDSDTHFTTANVVYFACSGDTGGKVIWPGTSPNVLSAGGTTLYVDGSGNFVAETGWNGSGGGTSKYEPRPLWQYYQNTIQSIVGNHRGSPDLSFDANPRTGVSVYWQGSWYIFGGTSVSAPSLAGVVNLASSLSTGFAASTIDELNNRIYANLPPDPDYAYDFRDIISGSAGKNRCKPGWDFVTGVGSNWGLNGK